MDPTVRIEIGVSGSDVQVRDGGNSRVAERTTRVRAEHYGHLFVPRGTPSTLQFALVAAGVAVGIIYLPEAFLRQEPQNALNKLLSLWPRYAT